VRFRKKAQPSQPTQPAEGTDQGTGSTDSAPGQVPNAATRGPVDLSEAPAGVDRVDLGSLKVGATPGRELRLQVEESSGQVASVMVVGPDGAVEFQAFAAPRNGNLWAEVRPQLVADVVGRGGSVEEADGPFGTELVCQMVVAQPDGGTVTQPTRVVGINGPRWMFRATFLGAPARAGAAAESWLEVLDAVVVDRGPQAMPVGQALPLVLPDDARRVR